MFPNPIAMSVMLERMLQDEIVEQLQIIRCDVTSLAGEIQGFIQPTIMLRQKRLQF